MKQKTRKETEMESEITGQDRKEAMSDNKTASGSGMTEDQRRQSVEDQNRKELEQAMDESTRDHAMKKRAKTDGKEFTATAPRGSKRKSEEE